MQETALHDIIALNHALRHNVVADDKVTSEIDSSKNKLSINMYEVIMGNVLRMFYLNKSAEQTHFYLQLQRLHPLMFVVIKFLKDRACLATVYAHSFFRIGSGSMGGERETIRTW